MSTPSNQTVADNALAALNTNATAGIASHTTNGRTVQRVGLKEQVEEQEMLESRAARATVRPMARLRLLGSWD